MGAFWQKFRSSNRAVMLVVCFAAGWLCPGLAALKGVMPWCLVYMLTVVFLRMDYTPRAVRPQHWAILAANIALPFALWGLLTALGVPERFGQVAFFTAITPTATSAPVIVNFLGGSITFASAGFLLSALLVSAVLPLAVPLVLHCPAWQVVPFLIQRICLVSLLPLGVAMGLRRLFGERARQVGARLTASTLYAWMLLVVIIAASASDTLSRHAAEFPRSDILWVLLIDLFLCVFQFALGAAMGYPRHIRECSQLLGQKNTSYTTYLAFACDAPFAALGPAFYVFFHNAWNGLQLMLHDRAAAKTRRTQ